MKTTLVGALATAQPSPAFAPRRARPAAVCLRVPFYTRLVVRDGDSAKLKQKKRRTAERILLLKSKLHEHFEQAVGKPDFAARASTRIGTWNLREFGGSKYEGRDFEELYYIAEVISHFDIMALQEVRADLDELEALLRILGPDWDYIATDVADGAPANGERMVFVFNERRARFRNIAGELTLAENGKIRASFGERAKLGNGLTVVMPDTLPTLSGTYKARLKSKGGGKALAADLEIELPKGSHLELPPGTKLVIPKGSRVESPGRGQARVKVKRSVGPGYRLRLPDGTLDDSLRQFARTPFLISFQVGWLKLNLCTAHIYFGDNDDPLKMEQRRREIELLSESLAKKAKAEFNDDGRSFMCVLGDFNIKAHGHPTMAALESSGFEVPDELKKLPGTNVKRDAYYDQIAFWKPRSAKSYVQLDLEGAGIFDFFEHVYCKGDEAEYRAEQAPGLKKTSRYLDWRTYKMSDHLPMWVQLRTDFSAEYLAQVKS